MDEWAKTQLVTDEFDVPAVTLKDRLSGRVEHRSQLGPIFYLADDERPEFAKFLIHSVSWSFMMKIIGQWSTSA